MPTYKTPGVYVEEVSVFPPSIAAVETAIPAFIGYTEKAVNDDGDVLTNVPTRITSLLEFENLFGTATKETVKFDVSQTWNSSTGAFSDTTITVDTAPNATPFYLYYCMQLFFANGGGPCHIVSVGNLSATPGTAAFQTGIEALEAYDEPTLLVFPDACLLSDDNHGSVAGKALTHCAKMQDRFTIVDVRNAVSGGTDTNAKVTTNFREKLSIDLDLAKYGAAYFPYLDSLLPYLTDDSLVQVATHTITDDGSGSVAAPTEIDDGKAINDTSVKDANNALYNDIKTLVAAMRVTVPPSGAVAGVYARVDGTRGVWKAPANVGLLDVVGPAVQITNDMNDGLNVDATSGKSVNAIRAFSGKGTLVWGARTFAGNSSEDRFVPVRRFLIFAEESIKKAAAFFVFEPNDANTWTKVQSMIESFLTIQWRDGALAGAKPEHAFYVSVGLNKTMSAQDILDGLMIVEIGLAIVRPAEFIVLRFAQKMQES